jgi:hypothetical protein
MRLTTLTDTREEYPDFELGHAAALFVRDVVAMPPGVDVPITTDNRTDLRVARAIARAAAAGGPARRPCPARSLPTGCSRRPRRSG